MGTPANETRKEQQTGHSTQRQDEKNRQDFERDNPNAAKGQNPMHKQQEHRGQNMKEEGEGCSSEQGQQGQQKKAEEQCHTQDQNAGRRTTKGQNK